MPLIKRQAHVCRAFFHRFITQQDLMHGKLHLFFHYCFLENPKILSNLLDSIDPPFCLREYNLSIRSRMAISVVSISIRSVNISHHSFSRLIIPISSNSDLLFSYGSFSFSIGRDYLFLYSGFQFSNSDFPITHIDY